MSLGWQSESALLPSKATPINVDSKSMLSMKALVYKIEQKLSNEGISQDGVYKRRIPKDSTRLNSSDHTDKEGKDLYKTGTKTKTTGHRTKVGSSSPKNP